MEHNHSGNYLMVFFSFFYHWIGSLSYGAAVSNIANTLAVVAGCMAVYNFIVKWRKDHRTNKRNGPRKRY